MVGSTFIQIPPNLEETQALRRFLDKLIQQLDIAFGNRGNSSFSTIASLEELVYELQVLKDSLVDYALLDGSRKFISTISYSVLPVFSSDTEIIAKGYVDANFSRLDGTNEYTSIVSYDSAKTFTLPNQLISKSYVDDNFTNNPGQADIANLNLTASTTYISSELQSVANKVDTILASLRLSSLIG